MSNRVAQWLIGTLIFFTLYIVLVVYPLARIANLILPTADLTLPVLLVFGSPFLLRALTEWWPHRLSRALARWSITLLGVGFIAFPLVALYELVGIAAPIDRSLGGWALLAALLLICGYACWNALTPRLRVVDVPIRAAKPGMTIAQVSDLHIGSLHPRQLERVVRMLEAAHPDYVALTGDIIDYRDIPAEDLQPLARLTMPVVFVIGNHERYVDVEDICDRLRGLGVQVLRNEVWQDDCVQFAGIDDAERKTQVAEQIPSLIPAADRTRVLLYHRPDGAEDAAAWGAQLMLCGHTHNGQIVPFNYLVRRFFPRIQGSHHVDGLMLHVSTGTGVWGPVLRLGSVSEVSILKFM